MSGVKRVQVSPTEAAIAAQVNWAAVGTHPTKGRGVFYSFGRRRAGSSWVYFLAVSDASTANALARAIQAGVRTVRTAKGKVLQLQNPALRHKRVR